MSSFSDKERIRSQIIECVGNNDEVDLSGMDFGNRILNLSNVKANIIINRNQKARVIHNSGQEAKEINNDNQLIKKSNLDLKIEKLEKEISQIRTRKDRLDNFINSYYFEDLTNEEKDLLNRKLKIENDYFNIVVETRKYLVEKRENNER